jgi:heavy metal sensor kinase
MRSIRLSLVVYFLVLLAVALGGMSLLAYQNTQRILRDNEAVRGELLETQYKQDCQREVNRLDNLLVTQARALGQQAGLQFRLGLMSKVAWLPLTLLNAGVDPNSQLLLPIWMTEHEYDRSIGVADVHRQVVPHIVFDEETMSRYTDRHLVEYFQVESETGHHWYSKSLGERSFPSDPKAFADLQLGSWQADNTELAPGVPVRRVRYKVPVARFQRIYAGPPRKDFSEGGRRGPSRPKPPQSPADRRPMGPEQHVAPIFFIQCAAETSALDAALVGLKDQRDADLTDLHAKSNESLAAMRNRLLLISLGTFAATLLGGFWLVRAGLAPLRRLSVAVSQVSAKDFRLPLDEQRLPRELRPIAERLTQTLEMLKRAFAREKQASADISHELRTPLAALLTTVEVGLRKTRSAEEYRELLADCQASGKQMSQLVERLLALARLDAGVDTLRPRAVDVAALAEQCANLVRPIADMRGLSLKVQRNGPIQVYTDPDKLREVVNNLLHNAIEYNRPQGSVELSVEQTNGHLDLVVKDTGIGIKPQVREHIFERFYRADPSRQADGLHAGLGLSIVKGYVDLMGGTITVDSIEGSGSTFRLQLPTNGAKRLSGSAAGEG